MGRSAVPDRRLDDRSRVDRFHSISFREKRDDVSMVVEERQQPFGRRLDAVEVFGVIPFLVASDRVGPTPNDVHLIPKLILEQSATA
jgi:hypothetical protein